MGKFVKGRWVEDKLITKEEATIIMKALATACDEYEEISNKTPYFILVNPTEQNYIKEMDKELNNVFDDLELKVMINTFAPNGIWLITTKELNFDVINEKPFVTIQSKFLPFNFAKLIAYLRMAVNE